MYLPTTLLLATLAATVSAQTHLSSALTNTTSTIAPVLIAPAPGFNGTYTTVTNIVTAYTTYCPAPTSFHLGGQTYVVTEATTITLTDCPCTLTHVHPVPPSGTPLVAPTYPVVVVSPITSAGASPTTIAGESPATPAVVTPVTLVAPTTAPGAPASTWSALPVLTAAANTVTHSAGVVMAAALGAVLLAALSF